MFSYVCTLGTLVRSKNDIGDIVEQVVYEDEIFCNEKSVRASEFYQAQAIGMKPEIVLEVNAIDYDKQKYVLYDEEEYKVLRTYKTSPERIELTLIRGVNDGDS